MYVYIYVDISDVPINSSTIRRTTPRGGSSFPVEFIITACVEEDRESERARERERERGSGQFPPPA
jgi:hypothetical protein